jgi:hypothetical protein
MRFKKMNNSDFAHSGDEIESTVFIMQHAIEQVKRTVDLAKYENSGRSRELAIEAYDREGSVKTPDYAILNEYQDLISAFMISASITLQGRVIIHQLDSIAGILDSICDRIRESK